MEDSKVVLEDGLLQPLPPEVEAELDKILDKEDIDSMDATNRIKSPRKRFNLTDLDNSNVFYNISICLFYAQWHYYEDTDNPILEKLNMGWNYYDSILDNVKDLNRCFLKLIKENEYNAALPLIRLQMDNLCVMYAEYLYPEKILLPILENGKELGRIKIDGDYIRAKALVDKLATQYEPLTTIWMALVRIWLLVILKNGKLNF